MAYAYARPSTLDETLALLRDEPDARLLGGGTDLIVALRKGRLRPPLVIDLKRVDELRPGIEERHGMLRIGATTVMTDLVADARIRRWFPALAEAADVVGSIQIRNRATLAGNLCNASPAADTAPALLVADAVVEVAGADGSRRVPVADFFVAPGRTVLRPAEVVRAVELPLPEAPMGAAFARMTRRRGVDLATVNLACAVTTEGEVRFGFGAVGPRPLRFVDRGGTLTAANGNTEARDAALLAITRQATPISNVRASREYREAMLLVLSRRALATARARLDEVRRDTH